MADGLGRIITAQANVKTLSLQNEFAEAKIVLKADYAKLGPEFGNETPSIIASLATKSQAMIVNSLQEKGEFTLNVDGSSYALKKEHFMFSTRLPEKYDFAEFSKGAIYLDKDVTDEMEAEGFAREIVRVIQQTRKEQGLKKTDAVNVFVKLGNAEWEKVSGMENDIKEKTGASKLTISGESAPELYKEVKVHTIRNSKVEIYFSDS